MTIEKKTFDSKLFPYKFKFLHSLLIILSFTFCNTGVVHWLMPLLHGLFITLLFFPWSKFKNDSYQ